MVHGPSFALYEVSGSQLSHRTDHQFNSFGRLVCGAIFYDYIIVVGRIVFFFYYYFSLLFPVSFVHCFYNSILFSHLQEIHRLLFVSEQFIWFYVFIYGYSTILHGTIQFLLVQYVVLVCNVDVTG